MNFRKLFSATGLLFEGLIENLLCGFALRKFQFQQQFERRCIVRQRPQFDFNGWNGQTQSACFEDAIRFGSDLAC